MNSTQEQWKSVLGSDGKHEVSSLGRVRAVVRPRAHGGILAGGARPSGHLVVKVWRYGKPATVAVKNLVAEAFLSGAPSADAQVSHRNGDRTDNRASNLTWVTHQTPMCTVDGCDRSVCGNGLCRGHYNRQWRGGDLRAHIPLRVAMTTEERFWGKVNVDGPCWEWTGAKSAGTGYGSFYVGDGSWKGAHRAAYEMLVGPVPEGLVLDHLCRHRVCVNPDHLEPVTQKENNRRGASQWAIKRRHR